MLLETRGLTKRYAGVTALDEVSLTLRAGEVHALIGENGAGKSTLINVLSGAVAIDAGGWRWRGQAARFASPAQAARAGIAVVHQEPQLIASLPALDNLFVGERFPTWRHTPLLDRAAMRRRATAACAALGVELPLDAPVAELSATQRTQLALVRCTLRAPELLILDEPTAALTGRDAQRLLAVVEALRARGKTVLYVSHRLDEVLQIADRVSVLRNGRLVATLATATQTHAALVEAMSGQQRAADASSSAGVQPHGAALLEVQDLASADGRVRAASLTLHAGELLGVYGLAGSGRTELLETLAGLRRRLRQRDAPRRGLRAAWHPGRRGTRRGADSRGPPRPRAAAGDARPREPDAAVPAPLRPPRLDRTAGASAPPPSRRWPRSTFAPPARSHRGGASLSGGNQQKLVFARALAMRAEVLAVRRADPGGRRRHARRHPRTAARAPAAGRAGAGRHLRPRRNARSRRSHRRPARRLHGGVAAEPRPAGRGRAAPLLRAHRGRRGMSAGPLLRWLRTYATVVALALVCVVFAALSPVCVRLSRQCRQRQPADRLPGPDRRRRHLRHGRRRVRSLGRRGGELRRRAGGTARGRRGGAAARRDGDPGRRARLRRRQRLAVGRFGVLSFITTLATGTMLAGFTFWLTGGSTVFESIPDGFTWLGRAVLSACPGRLGRDAGRRRAGLGGDAAHDLRPPSVRGRRQRARRAARRRGGARPQGSGVRGLLRHRCGRRHPAGVAPRLGPPCGGTASSCRRMPPPSSA